MSKLVKCSVCLTEFLFTGKIPTSKLTVCASCKKGAPISTPTMPDSSIIPTIELHDALLVNDKTSLDNLNGDFDKLEQMALGDVVDTLQLDRKITLLARLIIENILWKSDGLSKKEKFDAAIQAIRVIEGGKMAVWAASSDDKNLPKSQQQFFDEKERIEKRIVSLVDKYKLNKVTKLDLVKGAVDVIENEGVN